MHEAHLLISGRVQGVSYRYYAYKEAVKLDLKGYVKNLPDGDVEAVLQGDKESIEEFIKWADEGPPSANVTHIETVWLDVSTGKYGKFEII